MALTRVAARDIRLLALLRGFSFLGDAVALVTLFLRLSHQGRGWLIVALAVAGALPLVALAPVAGFVVDHVRAKPLLTALCIIEGLICAGLGFWHGDAATLTLVALLNCAVAFSAPGYSALVPTLSGEENLARAQGTLQAVQGVALTAGPALGGLLVAATGQSGPLYLDAATFVLAGVGTLALHGDRRPAPRRSRGDGGAERSRHQVSAGARLIVTDHLVRPVVVTVTVIMLSVGALNVVEIFFITRTLHASALYYGLVGTSFGVGSVVGSLAARRLSHAPSALVRTALLNIFVVSVLLGTVGLVERVIYVFPLMALTGLSVGVVNVASSTLFAVRTPEALRGRVFAAIGALFTSAEIGSMVLGGLLLSVVAPRTVYQLAGALSIVTVGIVGPLELRLSRRSSRRLGDHLGGGGPRESDPHDAGVL